jgi:hypothetical protein
MQPSTRFLHGLNASQTAWAQHRFLEVVRSGQPGSDDPATVLVRVTQKLETTVNDARANQLLHRLRTLHDEALELVLHNIEHDWLSPEEKRRRRVRKATYYGQRYFGARIIRGNGSISSLIPRTIGGVMDYKSELGAHRQRDLRAPRIHGAVKSGWPRPLSGVIQ